MPQVPGAVRREVGGDVLEVIDFDEARRLLDFERIPLYALAVLEEASVGEAVTCGECALSGRCPMRRGDGEGWCWQGRREDGD